MIIGIVTFWQTRNNYGQMLQCYALQQVLTKLGHDPFLIRYLHSEYRPSWHDRFYYALKNIVRFRWNHIWLKRKRLTPMTEKDLVRDFDTFKKMHLAMSATTYESFSELKQSPPQADCYITGSDQVWSRSLYFQDSKVFFLAFGEESKYRFSYAASFSTIAILSKYKSHLKKMLCGLDAVSVREKTGKRICDELGVDSTWVCDPTMLLSSNDYKAAFNLSNEMRQQVFIYSLNISSPSEIRYDDISEIAKRCNLNVVVTPSSGYISGKELFGSQVVYQYCTIKEWIENIANSKIVITTSFHGIVFCLLFHTPFIYVPLHGRFAKGNSRITDLLNYLHVDGHVLDENSDIESLFFSSFDWNLIDEGIYQFRDNSMSFLIESLSNAAKEGRIF